MEFNVSLIKKETKIIAIFLTMALVFNQGLYAAAAPLAPEGIEAVPTIALDASVVDQASEEIDWVNPLHKDPTASFLMPNTLSAATAPAYDSSVNTHDEEGRLIRTVRTLLQADGVTLARVDDTSFNPENGFKTEETFNYYDTQGRNTHRIHNLYCDDGITILQITETHFNVETGKPTSILIRNFNMEGILERAQRFIYHLNGNLSRDDDSRYDSVTGTLQKTYTNFRDMAGKRIRYAGFFYQDGRLEMVYRVLYNALTWLRTSDSYTYSDGIGQTRQWVALYRADGKAVLRVDDSFYNSATGFSTKKSITLTDTQGRRTRLVTTVYHSNGKPSEIDDRTYNVETKKILRQLRHFYNTQGKRIQSVNDLFYADGITKSRRINTKFDPLTQKVLQQLINCYSETGATVVCS